MPIPFTTLSLTIHVNTRLGLDECFRDAGLDRNTSRDSRNVNEMQDLSATGGSGIRQNLGTDVRLGKKTFFGMATTKEAGVRDQDSPFQTLAPAGEGYSLR